MSNIGFATLQVIPSLRGMESAMRSQLGGFGASAGQVSSRSFGDRFASGVRGLGSAVGGTIVSGVKTAGAVAGGLLATSLFTGFKRFSTIEDALSSMTTQLGDATQAGKLLDEILQVVRGTPFNFDQFAAAGQQLVGFGIRAEKIPGILTAVGEAAATQGSQAGQFADRLVTIFGQVAARGRVQLDDVWRISETGVNALAILANSFGVTTVEMQKLISKGAVPADKAIDALTKGIVQGSSGAAGATVAFGGTMAGLRKTLTGSFGGFKTAMARFGAAIVGPFGPALTRVFAALSDTFDLLASRASGFLKRFVASPGFDRFVALLVSLPDKIGPLVDRIGTLGPLVAGLGGSFGIMGAKSLPVIGNLLSGVNPLLAGFAALVAASPELRGAFSDIFAALGPLISQLVSGLQPVIASLVPIVEKVGAALGPVLAAVLSALLPVLPPLAAVFAEIASSLADVLVAVVPILPPLARFAALLIDTIGVPVLQAVAKAVGLIADAFVALPGPVQAVAGGLALGIGPIRKFDRALTDVFGPIRSLSDVRAAASLGIEKIGGSFTKVVGVVSKVGPLLGKVGGAFKAFGSLLLANPIFLIAGAVIALGFVIFKFRKQIGAALSVIGRTFAAVGKAIGRFFVDLPHRILPFAKRFFPLIIGVLFPPLLIPALLVKFWGPISRFFAALPGRVVGFAKRFLPIVLGVLFPPGLIVLALVKFWQPISSFFSSLPGRIIGFAKRFLPAILAVLFPPGLVVATLVKFWGPISSFFSGLPGRIVRVIGRFGSLLFNAGKALLTGLWNGAKTVAGRFIAFWAAFPSRISRALGNVTSWLGGTFKAAFDLILRVAGNMVATLISGFRFIASVWLTVVGSIIHGAATAFGWVPGIGKKLKSADRGFQDFKTSFLRVLDETADRARGWGTRTGTNYAAGLRGSITTVSQAATLVARQVGTRLEISSPAELGPLSLGGGPEGWGLRFGESYAKGLTRSAPLVAISARKLAAAAKLAATAQFGRIAGPDLAVPLSVANAPRLAPQRLDRSDRRGRGFGDTIIEQLQVNYPTPEPLSETLPKIKRRLALHLSR